MVHNPHTKKTQLTTKQSKFVKAMAVSGNGTQSAIAAGYSVRSAHAIANENLKKPTVRDALLVAIDSLDIPSKIRNNWDQILSSGLDPMDKNFDTRAKTILKAQDQIAGIVGLNAPTRSERKVAHFDVSSILPKGEPVHRQGDTLRIVDVTPMSPCNNDAKE